MPVQFISRNFKVFQETISIKVSDSNRRMKFLPKTDWFYDENLLEIETNIDQIKRICGGLFLIQEEIVD